MLKLFLFSPPLIILSIHLGSEMMVLYIKDTTVWLLGKSNKIWWVQQVTMLFYRSTKSIQNILRVVYTSAGSLFLPLDKEVHGADCPIKKGFFQMYAGLFPSIYLFFFFLKKALLILESFWQLPCNLFYRKTRNTTYSEQQYLCLATNKPLGKCHCIKMWQTVWWLLWCRKTSIEGWGAHETHFNLIRWFVV